MQARLLFYLHHSRQLIMSALLTAFTLTAAITSSKATAQDPHIALMEIDGAIGPATTDYFERALDEAEQQGAELVVLRMDTPGGLDAATRDIIKTILASPIPIVTYVHPAGARAASAGTYILYASHVAAMTPSTTLGAATPVQMGGGGGLPDPGESDQQEERENEDDAAQEQRSASEGDAMERKVVNDSVAFIRGLAARHNRNADWAERAVREAATLTATEAQQENVIDVIAKNVDELLNQLDGMSVQMENGSLSLATAGLATRSYEPDWRNQLLALITNPQVAYILLLIGIYGLLFEGYSPGAMVPGVVGLICLLLGLYALQVLPVNYAGLALIAAGVLLMLAEAFAPSFGILGIGGVIALVMGSLMLIDTDVPGMEVSRKLIGGIATASGLMMLGLIYVVGRNFRMKHPSSNQALLGKRATVVSADGNEGQVRVYGERWQVHCDHPLQVGQEVDIVQQQGLKLQVKHIT